ncbi:MAG: hypothetical protein DCC75_00810 [Proteobacteria bacterium]|nr:MAG: hypothetical protein DCC75_00810 [Pseudomonadota bacterium]
MGGQTNLTADYNPFEDPAPILSDAGMRLLCGSRTRELSPDGNDRRGRLLPSAAACFKDLGELILSLGAKADLMRYLPAAAPHTDSSVIRVDAEVEGVVAKYLSVTLLSNCQIIRDRAEIAAHDDQLKARISSALELMTSQESRLSETGRAHARTLAQAWTTGLLSVAFGRPEAAIDARVQEGHFDRLVTPFAENMGEQMLAATRETTAGKPDAMRRTLFQNATSGMEGFRIVRKSPEIWASIQMENPSEQDAAILVLAGCPEGFCRTNFGDSCADIFESEVDEANHQNARLSRVVSPIDIALLEKMHAVLKTAYQGLHSGASL